ncbi:lipid A export permease/ATP-binding protein MsbA [Beggiatoa leptomitoformis]|uniref:Lipid A export permease/ATP-binding protein MsbA n=1 Tax=Beggiatoa leptomitoformis TaxID=288004 RepID=A0A2N9YC03_9GAMM|nr:lipid A export permease/ATP-binding protein MsbA [Beggiatoa leptomitoformis]ALG66692.1 lipid A export permease/ATP-binding protein MsbA [Beggiatoa leptomitoformis]AUI67981.1 lipid A export permease/ATP-binding protein MsbA [Beggiatoa leptomitoformis]
MNSSTLYLRLLRYVKPHSRLFAIAIVSMVVMALTEPALPALLQPLLDEGFVQQNPDIIKIIPLLLLLVMLIKGIAMIISTTCLAKVATQVVTDLRQAMFEKILSLPTTAFDNISAGILLSKVTYDVSRVMAASTESLVVIIRDSLTVLGLLAWMFYLNWKLTLIVFLVAPVVVVTMRIVSKRLRGMNILTQDAMGNMTRILEETISGHKLVKIFGGQPYEKNRFSLACTAVLNATVKSQTISAISIAIVQMLTAIVLALIIYIAAQEAQSAAITVGGFVSLFTAMGMMFTPIKHLTKVNEQLQQGLAAAQSIFTLIDQASEQDSGTQVLPRLVGKIDFQQLNFTYQENTSNALHDLSLTINAGETIALVGASGSGKTTLANLIPRFYTITQGQILLDGLNINELPLANLRENIALVSQEVVLFNDTVAANIAYGAMANTPREKIIAAAKAAHAMEFIEKMPNGLETIIGERGVKLSGGQRQRLAIARALLKDAPILIFDEATSALDTQSERHVQDSLDYLKRGRTTIIIAHRLSTIAQADRIIVMDKGRIVEMGTHAQLLVLQGTYAMLYRVQEQIDVL